MPERSRMDRNPSVGYDEETVPEFPVKIRWDIWEIASGIIDEDHPLPANSSPYVIDRLIL